MKAGYSSEAPLTSMILYGITYQKAVTLQSNSLISICNKLNFQLRSNANSRWKRFPEHDRRRSRVSSWQMCTVLNTPVTDTRSARIQWYVMLLIINVTIWILQTTLGATVYPTGVPIYSDSFIPAAAQVVYYVIDHTGDLSNTPPETGRLYPDNSYWYNTCKWAIPIWKERLSSDDRS
jgi:hypothetical protein